MGKDFILLPKIEKLWPGDKYSIELLSVSIIVSKTENCLFPHKLLTKRIKSNVFFLETKQSILTHPICPLAKPILPIEQILKRVGEIKILVIEESSDFFLKQIF